MSMSFRVADIVTDSIVDGDGYRYVIFFQGCNHNCYGCHNPQTHSFNGGIELTDEDILKDLEKRNKARLMDITFSGGDPFFQAGSIVNLAKKLKEQNYNIWAYTGFIFDEFISFINNKKCDDRVTSDMIELLNYIDVVVDGPFILSKRTVEGEFVGSTNQRLVDVHKSLIENKVVLYELD